ncbi:MAG: hypothetical protein QNJ97_04995 [Myxococcota bacterium]|nr:hypothetical protein [Myxococcota bacterium]
MLKFLLDKFRDAPGPLKQTRLVVGDLAEEIVDLAGYYLKRRNDPANNEVAGAHQNVDSRPWSDAPPSTAIAAGENRGGAMQDVKQDAKKTRRPPVILERTLDVSPELEKALDFPKNQRKQEFKILAILWDAERRGLGTLSAKAVSNHGTKLGVAIRHENVRKVIRMRLGDYVDVLTVQVGSTSIYRYRLSKNGNDYFESKYLVQNP